VNGALLAEVVRASGQAAHYLPELESLDVAVEKTIQPGDLVLFLGAGDITKAAHRLAERLACAPADSRPLAARAGGELPSPAPAGNSLPPPAASPAAGLSPANPAGAQGKACAQ